MPDRTQHDQESGFLLVALIVAIFLILLFLALAAPRMAMQLKRDRELETQHRAQQYVRAIQLFYRKNKTYPNSIDALKKSNNQRFLRQEYIDPLTGQSDWRLIKVGENKTTVKGFFGEDLPGIAGASGLSGASSAGNSSGNSSAFGGSNSSAFGGSGTSAFGGTGTSAFGGGSSSFGTGGTSGSAGASGSSGPGGSGISSTDATQAGGSGGAFLGVGVPASGESILTVNGKNTYEDWEFLYDPRIETLKAKVNITGGGISSSSATGLGSASSLSSPTSTTNQQTPATTHP